MLAKSKQLERNSVRNWVETNIVFTHLLEESDFAINVLDKRTLIADWEGVIVLRRVCILGQALSVLGASFEQLI